MPKSTEERPPLIRLGSCIRGLRDYYDLTLEELAWPDCNPSSLSRIECGKQFTSAKLVGNLLGRMGESTFPWGYLFYADDIDQCLLQLNLIEDLRFGILHGCINQFSHYYTDGRRPINCFEHDPDRIPELIRLYKDTVSTPDDLMFINYIKNFYIIYPFRSPEEIIDTDMEILAIRRNCAPKEKLKFICFPNEIEKMIISDIALRHMDLGDYAKAEGLWEDLISKQRDSRIVSFYYWRRLALYRYNLALCNYLTKNPDEAKRNLSMGLQALQRGGEVTLSLYYKALYARIMRSEGSKDQFFRYSVSLFWDCNLIKKSSVFNYTVGDLLRSRHGLPTI